MTEWRFAADDIRDAAVLKELERRVRKGGIEHWRDSCLALHAAETAIQCPYVEDEYRALFRSFAKHYAYLKRLDLRNSVDSKLVCALIGIIHVRSQEMGPSELPACKDEVWGEVQFSGEELGSWAMKRCITHTSLFPATANDPADIQAALEAYTEALFFEFLAQTFNVFLKDDAAGAD